MISVQDHVSLIESLYEFLLTIISSLIMDLYPTPFPR